MPVNAAKAPLDFVYDYRLLTMLLIVANELLLHPVCISCYYFTLRRILTMYYIYWNSPLLSRQVNGSDLSL